MRAIEKNIFVRYITADDARQLRLADRVIEECRESGGPLFLKCDRAL